MLVDEAVITVRAGQGGHGLVHFRREKYVPKGGPDGGDGGAGGDVWLLADPALHTLREFARTRTFAAADGEPGRPKQQTGADGADRVLRVLPGTVVWEVEDREAQPVHWRKIADLTEKDQRFRVAKGGTGGRGNIHFATATYQTPQIAENGRPGEVKRLKLELKLLAELGLVGLPNAGKSSLLARLTAATPKVADYPFTTLEPNLGVLDVAKIGLRPGSVPAFVLADIPGLIEGAAHGRGLGHRFLRHLDRTRLVVHLIDATLEDPLAAYREIRRELAAWNPSLAEKPEIVAFTKVELLTESAQRRIYAKVKHLSPIFISVVTGRGLADLIYALKRADEAAARSEAHGA